MSLLALKDVSYHYDSVLKKKVLNTVNAEFENGKIYVIMGKSGSGKTTLLSLVSGLDICKNGEILYNGESLKTIDRDDYRARRIGVVFQSYNLLLNVSAVDNIVLSMNISGSSIKDKKLYAYELLERMGIDRETANRKVLKLSGGEQQRIAIARAVSHNPDLIIADEPTGNLDSDTESGVMEILASLARNDKKCVIIVTHSKKVASYADEVLGLSEGKLLLIK